MKKLGITAIALATLVAVGVGGAWYTGTQLEGVLQQNIEQANQQLKEQLPGAEVHVELTAFERGWFSSQARYRVTLPTEETDDLPPDLLIAEQIEHGPFPLSRLTAFQWWPVMSVSHLELEENAALAKLFKASAGRAPISLHSSIGYDKTITGTLEAAPLNWESEELSFSFSGLSANYETDTNTDVIKLDGHMDSLVLQDRTRAELQGVAFTVDRHRDDSGLHLGTGDMTIERLAVEAEGQPVLALQNLSQADVTTVDADGANMGVKYRIGALTYGSNELGSMEMDWTFSRFKPQALLDLVAAYNSVILSMAEQEQDPELVLGGLQAPLESLLDGYPRISLDNWSVKTAHGESRFSMSMELARPLSLTLSADKLMPQLIDSLEAHLSLSKPMLVDMVRYRELFDPQLDAEAWEQEATTMIDDMSETAEMLDLGRVEGDTISTRIGYAGGAVKLNGQPIELGALLGLMAGMPAF